MHYVAPVDRELLHLRSGDDIAYLTGVRLHLHGLGRHRHALDHLADLHLHVDAHGVVDIEHDACSLVTLEPLLFNFERIRPDPQFGRNEAAGIVRIDHAGGNCRNIRDRYFRAGND